MRSSLHSTLALALAACGGRISSESAGPLDSGSRDAPAATSADTWADQPIDASGLPTSLPMDCNGGAAPIAFQLPCAVGIAPLNVTECYALGDNERHPVLAFMVSLGYLAAHRNEPINLSDFPPPPISAVVVAGGVDYGPTPTHRGTLTISQVSIAERAYVGRFSVEFTGRADGGTTIVCSAADAPFWAIAGSFL